MRVGDCQAPGMGAMEVSDGECKDPAVFRGLGIKAWGLGFRVWGLGFGAWGLRLGVKGLR